MSAKYYLYLEKLTNTFPNLLIMRFFLTLIILFTTSNLFTQDISEGLIGHYPFNGNADDVSEFENHGENFGAVLTEDRFGNLNSAYLFNGTDSYITIPSSESLESPDTGLTMSAWINLDGYSLVGQSFGPVLMKSDNAANSFMYRLSISAVSVGSALNNWTNYTSLDTTLVLNEWHHIAVSFCSTNVKFYLNNELIIDQAFTCDIIASDLPLEIGRDIPGITEVFNGSIDDIRIYNRCISEDEIDELYLADPLSVESFQESSFSISPNPSSGKISIQANKQAQFNHVQLLDGLGRLVQEDRFSPTTMQTLNYEGIKKGLYHLVIFNNGSRSSIPLMIN